MAAEIIYLDFEVHLRDEARVLELQANPPGETSANGALRAIIRAPLGAAEEFAGDNGGVTLPLVLGYPSDTPTTGAYIFSRWFSSPASDASLVYPTDAATFVRKVGGWFGVPFLFGKTIRFYWRGTFFYDPADNADDPTAPGTLREFVMPRRWVDPGFANMHPNREGFGTSEMSRDAAVWTDTFGIASREQVFSRTFTMTDFTGGVADQCRCSWERLYIRLRRVGGSTRLWRCDGTVGANNVQVWVNPAGQLSLYNNSVLVGSTVALDIDRVYKLDLAFCYGDGGGGFGAQDHGGVAYPGANFKLFLDGVMALSFVPAAGVGLGGVSFHLSSTIGPSAAGETAEIDYGLWVNAQNPIVFNGIDFLNGSRLVLLRPKAFAPGNGTWAGPITLLKQYPIPFQHLTPLLVTGLTTSTALDELRVETDADTALMVPGSIGVAAICVTHVGHRGTTEGRLGYKVAAAAVVLETFGANGLGNENGTQDSPKHHRFMYAPVHGYLPLPPADVLPFEIHRLKGNDATIARTYQLMAVAELIGVFQECDYPADLDPALAYPIPFRGIHNAPYPQTPWATSVAPPYAPVVIKSGTYVGTGTELILNFKAPVNWIWIRKATGAGNPTMLRWWSSMLAPSVGGMKNPHGFMLPVADVDPGFVPTEPTAPTGVGAMPDRSVEVDAIVAANPGYFTDDDSRRDLLGIIARELNSTLPADGNNWGLLIKNDRTPPFVPVDTLVWLPTLEHVDVLSGSGGIWIERDPIPAEWAWLNAGFDGAQQKGYRIHIAGSDLEMNRVGDTYVYTSVADPGMRFLLNGAIAHSDEFLPRTRNLIVPTFTPLAALILEQRQGNYASLEMFFKGPGHAANAMSRLDAGGTSNNGISFGAGVLAMQTAFGAEVYKHAVFAAMRSDDGSGDPNVYSVFGFGSYIGNGLATRDLVHTVPGLSGKRPLWILVAAEGAASYVKDCQMPTTTAFRADSGATSATAIMAAAINQFTVGISLNANLAVYHYMIIWGGTVAAASGSGMSECGEFWPVPPDRPPCLLELPDCDPDPPEPPDDPPGDDGGDGDPPTVVGGGDDDILTDLSVECEPFTKRVFNDALSRIGISNRIRFLMVPVAAAWSAATLYAVRAAATRLGVTYYCILAHTNQQPPNATYWSTAVPPVDNSEESDVCRLHYARAIESTLRDFPWPFATRYAVLSLLGGSTTSPVNRDWTYSYRQPSDCVFERRLAVVREGAVDPTPPPFQLSFDTTGGRLFTNQAAAQLEYTARPACTASQGDPLFIDALTWRLASLIAGPLTRIADVTKLCLAEYEKKIATAFEVMRPGNPGPRSAVDALALDPGAGALAANVAVVNRALIRIGAQTIGNLATEQSREAEAARLIFEDELRSVLRDYPWAFATAYVTPAFVAGTATVPVNHDWTYAYRAPADAIKIRRMATEAWSRSRSERDPEMFRLGSDATGALIYARVVAPTFEYTARILNCVLRADAIFRDAFAWRLAASLAPSLAQVDPDGTEQLGRGPQDRPRERKATEAQLRARAADAAWRQYYLVIEKARLADASEQQGDSRDTDADWIRGRE